VVIPHFDVHGPVSASIGDECLGCLRGWAHFCPVLQRRLPAVDQRARLQPPLSSLVVTRIGLGVRQNLQTKRPPTEPDKAQDTKPRTLFEPWDTEETQKLKTLPVLQSASLGGYERMDEVVEFIEKASAMKIKEPSEIEEASTFSRRSKHQENGDARATDGVHKCGRCRTIVKGKLGCFQCRRAQLVINLAKEDKEEPGKMLRVQTAALARMDMKERSHAQTPQDQAIAAAMLAERWMPCTVLEAHKVYAPSPYNPRGKRTLVRKVELPDYSDSEEEEVVDEEADESPGSEEIIGRHSVTKDFHLEGDRRVRSARSAHPIAEALEPGEHQALLESNRKEVNAFHKRIVTVACCGMLHALLRRDPLMLFRNKVTVDGYTDVVKNPIDFSKIRAKILKDGYQSVAAFATDVKLLCENALLYNSESTIYAKSATEMLELLATMQKSAAKWISTLRDAYSRHLSQDEVRRRKMVALLEDIPPSSEDEGDPFDELREEWPEAVEMLENEAWLKAQISSDFIRTKENEIAFYGSLAVSRTAIAAEASLAPYSDSMGNFSVVGLRSHIQDAHLRDHIDRKVSEVVRAPQLKDPSTWREESVHTLLRRLQSSRVDAATASLQGCARCDGLNLGQNVRIAMKAEQALPKAKKPEDSRRVLEDKGRVDPSRCEQATGLASAERRELIGKRRQQTQKEQFDSVNDACVSVQGSKVHGWGLYADQEFDSEDVVAEYVGEYIDNTTAEERETLYHEQRIQDYMFRVNDDQVIDATIKGGNGRYANHSCEPNCYTKTIQSKENSEWKRVMIIALRPITIHEEITYDYQFPLELDLDKRLPCNCRSESCRGFMNWDLPEKGNTRPLLVQRRGANMRDRIRRLGRPLKRDENFVTI
jgi:ferritin-like metal-binding protein YciE